MSKWKGNKMTVFEKQSSHAVFTYQTFAKITQKQEWSFLSISRNYTNFKLSCHKTLKTEPTANLLSNAPNCFPMNISIKESTNHLFPPTPLKTRILNYYQKKSGVRRCLFVFRVPTHAHAPAVLPSDHDNLWVSIKYSSWKGDLA